MREHRSFFLIASVLTLLAIIAGIVFVTQAKPSGGVPNGRIDVSPSPPDLPLFGLDPGLAYDPIHHQVVLFNRSGETWLWSGTRWTLARASVSPHGRDSGTAMAWDTTLGAALMFGGSGSGGADDLPRDTWAWNGLSWHRVDDGSTRPAGGWAAMAYDPIRKQMVLVVWTATTTASPGTTITWTLKGKQWQQRPHPDQPAGPDLKAAFDPRTGTVLVVSESCSASGPPAGNCESQTWSWDGFSWHRLASAHEPPASAHMTLAYDHISAKLLLLTEAYVPYGRSNPAQTWGWDGRDWGQLSPVGQPNSIVYAVNPGYGHDGTVWAFEDLTPSLGATRVDAAWAWDGAAWVPAGNGPIPTPS